MSLLQSEWRHQGGATHPIVTQHQSWFKILWKSGKAGNSLARGDNRDLHLTKCRGRGSPKLTLLSSCCFSPIVWTLDIIMDQCLHFTTAAMQAPKNNNKKNNTMPTIKHDTGSVMIEGCSGPQRIAVTVGTLQAISLFPETQVHLNYAAGQRILQRKMERNPSMWKTHYQLLQKLWLHFLLQSVAQLIMRSRQLEDVSPLI